jgi:exo-beta-1,3-glucanase (GH17 family)/cellulose synthase/poly-beta-1,6-N-acetylglucosamine synthase-like glycosyltransferase
MGISGVTYEPFRSGQKPGGRSPSREQIREDMQILSGLSPNIRTYSVAGILAEVPAIADEFGLRVTLGVWISDDLRRNEVEIERAIDVANRSSNVVAVLVGNEVLLRDEASIDTLVSYIERVRDATGLPVSTSEVSAFWFRIPSLVSRCDFIAAHILPFWEGIPHEDAVGSVIDLADALAKAYPSKPMIISEVGWPSHGKYRRAATGPLPQAVHLRKLIHQLNSGNWRYFVVEAFDQHWKIGEGTTGASWGIYSGRRRQKFRLSGDFIEPFDVRGFLYRLMDASRLSSGAWRMISVLLAGCVLLAIYLCERSAYRDATMSGWLLCAYWVVAICIGLYCEIRRVLESVWTPDRCRDFTPIIHSDPPYPKVSIHVPCCNEPPDMVNETLRSLARLDYPNFEVMVIDNNTASSELWKPIEACCEALGDRFKFFHVSSLKGFKSGALNFLIEHLDDDVSIVGIVDCDYQVESRWLSDLVPHFNGNKNLALIQAPQAYRDNKEGISKKFYDYESRDFFSRGMLIRNDHNAIIQCGTMTLIRRDVLQSLRWSEWCICEDTEFGLRAMERGYETGYLTYRYGRGLIPDTFGHMKRQRFRWAYGAVQILKRHAHSIFLGRSGLLNGGQRYHFIAGWLPWAYQSLKLIWCMFILVWSAIMIMTASSGTQELPLIFSLPPIFATLWMIGKFAYLYRRMMKETFVETAGSKIIATALSYTIGKAFLYGCFTSHMPFKRTPKNVHRQGVLSAVSEVWEEVVVVALLFAEAFAICARRSAHDIDSIAWVLMLLALSLPFQMSLVMALLFAKPVAVKIFAAPAVREQRGP